MTDNSKKDKRKEHINLRIDSDLMEDARLIAEADERSMSYVLRKAIQRCLPDMKRELGLIE